MRQRQRRRSTQGTTEDDPPNHNHGARRTIESLRTTNSSTPHLNGHETPNLSPETPGRVAQTASVAGSTQSEVRGMTPWAPLQNYNVTRSHSPVNPAVEMDVHRKTDDFPH